MRPVTALAALRLAGLHFPFTGMHGAGECLRRIGRHAVVMALGKARQMVDQKAIHILVVDDDKKVRMLLRRCFEGEGYRVAEAATGADVTPAMQREDFDLVTLDLTLPDMDGLSVARLIRERSRVPIIMVTGKGEMIDRVVGLEVGADDYIAKPFHLREVLARVRAVLRRSSNGTMRESDLAKQADRSVFFDGWVFDPQRRELRDKDGSACSLTSTEFRLLEVFINHANRVLTRDQIMDLLKGHEWSPIDRSIDNLVARLRRKIEPPDESPNLIKTVRGLGYTFTPRVQNTREN